MKAALSSLALLTVFAGSPDSRAGRIADLYHSQSNALASPPPMFQTPVPTNHGITEIGIERTRCFGTCPAYTLVIRSDGSMRYLGEAHVEKLGGWQAKTDVYTFHRLANFIVDSGFAEMTNSYSSQVTDGDIAYTTFVRKGRRKTFMNYLRNGPAKLWALEQLIDAVAAQATWTPLPPSTNRVEVPKPTPLRTAVPARGSATNSTATPAARRP